MVRFCHWSWFESLKPPESHTLIVLSRDPETMVFPSGEKATDKIQWPCAFVFWCFSSSVAVHGRRSGQISHKRAGSSR